LPVTLAANRSSVCQSDVAMFRARRGPVQQRATKQTLTIGQAFDIIIARRVELD
jgi:hypothetical protein